MNSSAQETTSPSFDELNPARLFNGLKNWLQFIRKRILWIVSIALVFGLIGAFIASGKKKEFTATLTFSVDEENTLQYRGGVAAFARELGLVPADAGNVFSSIGNIQEVFKSRNLIEKTLRSSVLYNNKKILLAEFFLDSLDYRKEWLPSDDMKLNFSSSSDNKAPGELENSVMSSIYKTLLAKHLKIALKDKTTSILAASCVSSNEIFSKLFTERWVEEVTLYYIDLKTQRSRTNLQIIEKRNDSVKNAFIAALYNRAGIADADMNLVRESFNVPKEKKQTDIQILQNVYADLSRNLESAKTSLLNDTPIIQILDTPLQPLDSIKPSIIKQFLLFGIIGLMGGIMLFSFLYLLPARKEEDEFADMAMYYEQQPES